MNFYADAGATWKGAIAGRDSLRVPPAWGRHIVEVLLAAEESSRTGREVEITPRALSPALPFA